MLATTLVASLMGGCRAATCRVDEEEGCELDSVLLLQTATWLEGVHDFGLDANTWLGLEEEEAPSDSHQSISMAMKSGLLSERARDAVNTSHQLGASGSPSPPVEVVGLFDTGTNLLWKLLEKNFAHLRGSGAVGLPIWKHAKPTDILDYYKNKPHAFKDLVIVAVIRDPMSWVQSLRKAPYDLGACVHNSHWATGGCEFPEPGGYGSSFQRGPAAHTQAFHVDNIESVWNEWNSQYDRLGELGFGAHAVISYEELVLDTEGALSKVAKAMRVPPPTFVQQQQQPAKSHGDPNGRLEAIRKLTTKSYLALYTEQTRREVCARLDWSLMHAHGYRDCDGW